MNELMTTIASGFLGGLIAIALIYLIKKYVLKKPITNRDWIMSFAAIIAIITTSILKNVYGYNQWYVSLLIILVCFAGANLLINHLELDKPQINLPQ